MGVETETHAPASKLLAVKGMNDILPPESGHWEWLEEQVRRQMALHAYQLARTPVLEPTALFVRGTGEGTDIVEKEMYSFEDRLNGEALTLRPENTPGIVRAAIEHNLIYDGGKRLYYLGPMFRHERPQRGRYRQFYQLGAEALGFAGPSVDAEIIVLAWQILRGLGLDGFRLELNSLGLAAERRTHRQALIAYFEAHLSKLDADSRRRLHTNPLRILDTKNPDMQSLVQNAPRLIEYLGASSLRHFSDLKALLDACAIPWTFNPRLVRGLDYYSHTVFEFVTDELGAQGTICGGGRYDGLFEVLGGKPAPAVGWGMGMERVLELLRVQNRLPVVDPPDAFAVVTHIEGMQATLRCLQLLRSSGVRVQMYAPTNEMVASVKAQFKRADMSGARYALIFGPDEIAQGVVSVKALRGAYGPQIQYRLDQVSSWAQHLQSRA